MTVGVTTLDITTFSRLGLIYDISACITCSIKASSYAEFHLFIVLLSVIILSVIPSTVLILIVVAPLMIM